MNRNSPSQTLSVVVGAKDNMLLIVQLLLLLALTGRTDGYDYYRTAECITSSADLSDVEYIDTYYFNKDPVIRFNSTVGKYVGYTELGVKNAERYNNDPAIIQPERGELERYCKNNLPVDFSGILSKSVKPTVKVSSEQEVNGGKLALLMCSAYGFYPRAIEVYWLRDGIKMTADVISTEEMADGDWYYQVHSHLEYTPKSGEKISCVVEHISSDKPIIQDWEPSLSEAERNKIAIGASGLVLGIILAAAGFLYYKKKSSGRILVPS